MMRWITFCSAVLWIALAFPVILQADENPVDSNPAAAAKTVEERIATLEAQTQKTNESLKDILGKLTKALQPPADAPLPVPPPATDAVSPEAEAPAAESSNESEREAKKVAAEEPPTIEPSVAEPSAALSDLSQRVAALEQQAAARDASLAAIQNRLERLAPVVDVLANLRVLNDTALKVVAPLQTPRSEEKETKPPLQELQPQELLGKLTVQNDTDHTQTILINGVGYDIAPGTFDKWLPKGELTTQLKGLEEAKTWSTDDWTWHRQNFELKIIIEN